MEHDPVGAKNSQRNVCSAITTLYREFFAPTARGLDVSKNTKYPRTWHFPFSPGKGEDDKIQWEWEACLAGKRLVYTEKLDGGNTMLSKEGVFARSHLEPASHPSFDI